jgi:hypothetical protein
MPAGADISGIQNIPYIGMYRQFEGDKAIDL